MAIVIKHRFFDRLTFIEGYQNIDKIIIGTFNPGLPDKIMMNETENRQFEQIKSTQKFQRFNEVKNYYDRPQNRFWKIMDHINDLDFYQKNEIKSANPNGLKFYKNMDRKKVYARQLEFCKSKSIFITDIVTEINPISFCEIYDNFPDSIIENSNPKWNTENIINMIKLYSPNKIIINFNVKNKIIPKISAEIETIRLNFPHVDFLSLPSTSGAAGNTYEDLIEQWRPHFV